MITHAFLLSIRDFGVGLGAAAIIALAAVLLGLLREHRPLPRPRGIYIEPFPYRKALRVRDKTRRGP